MRVAINRTFNGNDDALSKVNYVEMFSPNRKHKLEMMECGIMRGMFCHATINIGNDAADRHISFAIPEADKESLQLNWSYSGMMSAGFYDASCPTSNIKFDLGKEYKSDNNDKVILKITDTQAEDIEGFSYGENINILKMPLSVSSMKMRKESAADDEILKALLEAKAAEKMTWYTGDEYRFYISSKYTIVSFESYDTGIRVSVGQRKTEYSVVREINFNIENPSFTIFELYKFLKLGKGGFLYSLDGFGDPNDKWISIAQNKNTMLLKFKDWKIDIEEEDVCRFSIEDYEISDFVTV